MSGDLETNVIFQFHFMIDSHLIFWLFTLPYYYYGCMMVCDKFSYDISVAILNQFYIL